MHPIPTRDGTGPSHIWLYAILVGAAVFHVVFIARASYAFNGTRHFTLFDDAMISMRYGRNLAEGHGLVWNPGEHGVEGITNPLWTVWMAVLHLLPVSDAKMSGLVSLTSSLLLLGTIAVVWAVARRIAPESRVVPPVAALLTAQSYALAMWALRGMEVGLLAFLVVGAMLAALRIRDGAPGPNVVVLGVVLASAVLTRQDAVLPAAVIAVYAWFVAPPAVKRRVAITGVAALAGTTVVLTLFRIAYYGDALPNTYYLKMTGVSLSDRFHRGWVALRQVTVHQLAPFVAVAALAFTGRRRRQPELYALGAMCVAQTAYSLFVGGDAWENEPVANRYLAVALPALFLLAAIGAETIVEAARRAAAFRIAAILGVIGASTLWFEYLRSHHGVLFTGVDDGGQVATIAGCVLLGAAALSFAYGVLGRRIGPTPVPVAWMVIVVVIVVAGYIPARVWARTGASLAREDAAVAAEGEVESRTTAPDARIAVWWAGNGPYFSRRESIDVLGKSDRHVARARPALAFRPGHNKIDLDYSVRHLRPDMIDTGVVLAPSGTDGAAFTKWGYEEVVRGIFVRRGSNRVDRAALVAGIEHVRAEFGG